MLELTPGPNMAWLALLTATACRPAGLAAAGGIAIGLAVQAGLAILGVAVLLASWPGLYTELHLAGVGYLLYLAVESLRDAGEAAALSSIYLAVATAIHFLIVLAAGSMRGWLADPAVSVRMHRMQALTPGAVALWLYWRG